MPFFSFLCQRFPCLRFSLFDQPEVLWGVVGSRQRNDKLIVSEGLRRENRSPVCRRKAAGTLDLIAGGSRRPGEQDVRLGGGDRGQERRGDKFADLGGA